MGQDGSTGSPGVHAPRQALRLFDGQRPHFNTWPYGAISPWRSEQSSSWEGAYRVPCFVRWPGHFKAGSYLNGIVTHQEWLSTLLAAAGDPDVVEKLREGYEAGDKSFRVWIDGYNVLPYLQGETNESPRKFFFYSNDDGKIVAIRMHDWKLIFMEQRAKQLLVWMDPFVELRLPKILHLRRDPFERADEHSNSCFDWVNDQAPAPTDISNAPGCRRQQQPHPICPKRGFQ